MRLPLHFWQYLVHGNGWPIFACHEHIKFEGSSCCVRAINTALCYQLDCDTLLLMKARPRARLTETLFPWRPHPPHPLSPSLAVYLLMIDVTFAVAVAVAANGRQRKGRGSNGVAVTAEDLALREDICYQIFGDVGPLIRGELASTAALQTHHHTAVVSAQNFCCLSRFA